MSGNRLTKRRDGHLPHKWHAPIHLKRIISTSASSKKLAQKFFQAVQKILQFDLITTHSLGQQEPESPS